jgi:hypothetical protein
MDMVATLCKSASDILRVMEDRRWKEIEGA